VSGGGAGVGRPSERDPEEVLADVRNELVSVQMAKDVYKVVIDPAKMQVLEKETRALRDAQR
jgi:N-methylhydantoinase B